MKKHCIAGVIALVMALASTAAIAQDDLIFYLDFDQVNATYSNGDDYIINSPYDIATSVTQIYARILNGDGIEIGPANGDGTDKPNTPGQQGGNVMMLDSGGFEEGLIPVLAAPYPVGDYTFEVTFWTSTNNLPGQYLDLGIQYLLGSEWPDSPGNGQLFNGQLRILGNGSVVGRPADSGKLEWNAGNTLGAEVRCLTINPVQAQTWQTVAGVFDFNESNPANSEMRLYLDGVLQSTVAYDATLTGNQEDFTRGYGAFGTPAIASGDPQEGIGAFRYSIGCSLNRVVNGSDNRGFNGAIDAVAISKAALGPGTFVLPAGFEPPAPLTTQPDAWPMYK